MSSEHIRIVREGYVHVFTFEDEVVVTVAGSPTIDEVLAAEGLPADAMTGASRIAR